VGKGSDRFHERAKAVSATIEQNKNNASGVRKGSKEPCESTA
jgi:hypothetical protein